MNNRKRAFGNFLGGYLLGLCFVYIISQAFVKLSCFHRHIMIREENHADYTQPWITNQKRFMFVGVMTTRLNLRSRAAAINRTWGKLVPGKLIFFVGKGEKYSGNLPVVVLNDVLDNEYPPQKKSFAMLKYIHDNHLDNFEWFMRADDDVFIHIRHMERFLRSVNSSRRWYVGQPGLGDQRERGKLGLASDSSFYCLGGPGIVITRAVLQLVVQGIPACLNNTVTAHEDTEVGRCISQSAGVFCTSAFEFSTLFFQNYEKMSDPLTMLDHALTVHPVKQPHYVYRLEYHVTVRSIQWKRKKISHLTEAIANMEGQLYHSIIRVNTNNLKRKSVNSKRQNVEQFENEDQNMETFNLKSKDKHTLKKKIKKTERNKNNNENNKKAKHLDRGGDVLNLMARSTEKAKSRNHRVKRSDIQILKTGSRSAKRVNHVDLNNKRDNKKRIVKRDNGVGGNGKDIRHAYQDIFPKNADNYSTYGAWDFIKLDFVYSISGSLTAPYKKLSGKGRELGLAAAIASLKHMRPGLNKYLFSYSKISVGSGLQHFLVVQPEKSQIRRYMTIQHFLETEINEDKSKIVEDMMKMTEDTPKIAEYTTEMNEGSKKPRSMTKRPESRTETTEYRREIQYGRGVIYIILPLYKRSKMFFKFLHWLKDSVSNYHSEVFLRIVLYKDKEFEYLVSQKYVSQALNNTSEKLHVKVLLKFGSFSRAGAISHGLKDIPSHGLVLIIDVDLRITEHFLRKVYLNTKFAKQVFFPISFTQFDPHIRCHGNPKQSCDVNRTDFSFDDDYGMWRHFGYGIVGVYKNDVINVGGFNTEIKGWGKEDVDFFDKCLKHGLLIFRSPDPGLLHVHHERSCDSKLRRDQFNMCMSSSQALYGSQSTLSNIILDILDTENII